MWGFSQFVILPPDTLFFIVITISLAGLGIVAYKK